MLSAVSYQPQCCTAFPYPLPVGEKGGSDDLPQPNAIGVLFADDCHALPLGKARKDISGV